MYGFFRAIEAILYVRVHIQQRKEMSQKGTRVLKDNSLDVFKTRRLNQLWMCTKQDGAHYLGEIAG